MSRIQKEVWIVFSVVIGVFVFSFCLAGCGDGGPDKELVVKAAKQGIRVRTGNMFSPLEPISFATIVKRHKSYQSCFKDPGDLIVKYPFIMSVHLMKYGGTIKIDGDLEVEFVMFKRLRDDSWWYETPSGHCMQVE